MAEPAYDISSFEKSSDASAAPYTFYYFADANVIDAEIASPTIVTTDDKYEVTLPQAGGYEYLAAAPLPAAQGIVTFSSGSAQVSGVATADGYQTTAIATISNLSIGGVLTADVVQGKLSTLYPRGNAVPSVNFYGSYFQNLRINGSVVTVNENCAVFGTKPVEDGSYFNDPAVLSSMQSDGGDVLQCTLVEAVSGVRAPAAVYGNTLVIPGLGTVRLAQVRLTRTASNNSPDDYTYKFSLDMICAQLQGTAKGKVRVITLETNGGGSQGGGGPVPDRGRVPPPPPSIR